MTVFFFQANLIFESTARIKTVQGAPLREGRVFITELYYSPKIILFPKTFQVQAVQFNMQQHLHCQIFFIALTTAYTKRERNLFITLMSPAQQNKLESL
jgi:hypothetical protein